MRHAHGELDDEYDRRCTVCDEPGADEYVFKKGVWRDGVYVEHERYTLPVCPTHAPLFGRRGV